MPPCSCPGIEHTNARPLAGTSTSTEAVSPGAAATVVPSANVMSCGACPVLARVTVYGPGVSMDAWAGVNPRSKASMAIVPLAVAGSAGSDGAALPADPATGGPDGA